MTVQNIRTEPLAENRDESSLPPIGMDQPIERRPNWARRGLVVGAVLLGLALATAIPGYFEGNSLRVTTERLIIGQVTRGQFEDYVPLRGRVTPDTSVYLDAVEGGRVEVVHIEDGDEVNAGDALVTLSNTTLRLDVITREAAVSEQLNNLRTLELQLERNRHEHVRNLLEIDYEIDQLSRLLEKRRELASDGHIAHEDIQEQERELRYLQDLRTITARSQQSDLTLQATQIEQLRATADQLHESLEFARGNLNALLVRAPIHGTVTALNAEIGQSLGRGERIGQVDSPDGFKLVADIDEFYISRVAAGQQATILIDGESYDLRVGKIYPQVRNGLFEVDLLFIDEQPSGIRRGQTIQARLILGDPTESILVPYGAYYQASGGNWLFVLADDGQTATRRDVRLGRRNSRYVEVLDGLSPGERFITSSYSSYDGIDQIELN